MPKKGSKTMVEEEDDPIVESLNKRRSKGHVMERTAPVKETNEVFEFQLKGPGAVV